MKLFNSPASPYARKVRIVMHEKALTGLVEQVNIDVYSDPAELLAANPLGKIPTLIIDDGRALFDSPVICAYLDAHPQGQGERLRPHSGMERWMVMRAEALADGIMDLSLARTMENRKPEAEKSPTLAARQQTQLLRALDVAADELRTQHSGFTLGHIAMACALGYLDLRHGDLEWRNGRDELAAWWDEIARRPSIVATNPV